MGMGKLDGCGWAGCMGVGGQVLLELGGQTT